MVEKWNNGIIEWFDNGMIGSDKDRKNVYS